MTGDRVIAIGTPDQIIKLEELIMASGDAESQQVTGEDQR